VDAGGHADVTKAQASIVAMFDLPKGVMYPLRLSPERKGMVQLCLAYLVSLAAFVDPAARQLLYDELVEIVGPLSTRTMNGYPGFDVRKLNDTAVRASLTSFLRDLCAKAQSA
jgi:hypothetical protein